MTATPVVIDGETRIPMTYEEWLAWAADGQSEWVDGEAIVFMPSTDRHQDLVGFLDLMLRYFVRVRGLGRLFVAPFEMKLSPRSSRQPDLLFVATRNLDRVARTRLIGPADLVIEIVSDDSVSRDWIAKREEYAAGVPEYWIIDCRPGHEREEFLLLGADGRYHHAPLDECGRFHSVAIPGIWLDPAWLRQDPLPLERDCLAAIDPTLLALPGGEPAQ